MNETTRGKNVARGCESERGGEGGRSTKRGDRKVRGYEDEGEKLSSWQRSVAKTSRSRYKLGRARAIT
jgi:hypothetical protein